MKIPWLPKGTLRNINYLICLQWRINKLSIALDLLFGLTTALSPLVAIIFPKIILDSLLQKESPSIPFVLLAVFSLVSLIFEYLLTFIKRFQGDQNEKGDYGRCV